MPFYPSPRRDDGYDIADYRGVHPDYGSIEDVRRFIELAHAKGMRVITELVLNHTSDQHPWFQRARQAPPGSPERDFYVWSDTDKRYAGTRIIFLDTEKSNWTWDEEAKAYYWHRFYSHQPDLNFDNPAVLEEALSVMRFWLDMGVDGLRLDAVPYLVEREGTNNENLPETHAILKRIRAEVDAHYPGRMLLAEANQWPEDVQAYFGDGDECHMLFHFPLMPRMYMAIAQEDRFPITDIMRQTPEAPEGCQWATFLRNHDELTLEMVTDKERDYLWKTYAADKRARLNLGIRRRLAPLLEHDRRRIELMNSLLLTIMGTPDPLLRRRDRHGRQHPSRRPRRRAHADAMDVRPQWRLLAAPIRRRWCCPRSWTRSTAIRRSMSKRNGAVRIRCSTGCGACWWCADAGRRSAAARSAFLRPQNRKVLAYLREFEGETILCVANVSRTAQAVELDLSEFAGRTPVELSGEVAVPEDRPAHLSAHASAVRLLLVLAERGDEPAGLEHGDLRQRRGIPHLRHARRLERHHRRTPARRAGEGSAAALRRAAALVSGQERRRARGRRSPTRRASTRSSLFGVLDVQRRALCAAARHRVGRGAVSAVRGARWRSHVCGAARASAFSPTVSPPRSSRARFCAGWRKAADRAISPCSRAPAFAEIAADAEIEWPGAEQSNSTLIVGRQAVIKLFRRLVDGIHPEAEMVRVLTERGFTGIASLMGEVRYKDAAVAVVQRFVENQGDAFQWSLEQVGRLIDDKAVTDGESGNELEAYRNFIAVAGRRLGEMHEVLAQPSDDPDFAPEKATHETIAAWRDRLHAQLDAAFALRDLGDQDALREAADKALAEGEGLPLTRIHGDLHLGQVLVAAGDAIIIDFEGEPAKPLCRTPRQELTAARCGRHAALVRLCRRRRRAQRPAGEHQPERRSRQDAARGVRPRRARCIPGRLCEWPRPSARRARGEAARCLRA